MKKLGAGPANILPDVSSASRSSPGVEVEGTPSSPVARGPGGRCASPGAQRAARPPRLFWPAMLFIPGGVLLAVGVITLAVGLAFALPGAVLFAAALRRLTAALPASEPAPRRQLRQDDPRPRVVWPGQGKGVH